jgi:hypothetical protein
LKKILLTTILILIIVSFSNISKIDDAIKTNTTKEFVDILVSGKEEEVIVKGKIEYETDLTAFEVLKNIIKENKLQMETKGIGEFVYISGINNLYEKDEGPLSGWMYKVNDEIPNVGIASYKLEPNDNVEVYYVLDLGKEFLSIE